MRDLALLLVLLPLVPMSLRFPHVGVMLWAWTAVLAPNQFLYGFLSSVPLGKIFAALTIIALLFSKEPKNFRLDRTFAVMAGLLAVSTVSAFTTIVDNPLNWDLYGKLAKIMVFAYIVSAIMATRVRIHALVATLCLALAFHGSTQGLMFIGSGGGHKFLGSTSFGDNNSFALAMLMNIPLAYYMFCYSSVKIIRAGWVVSMVLSAVSVVGTFSRGGFIGMIVLALFFIANSKRKVLGLALIVIAGVLIYNLAPEAWFHRIDTIQTADEDSSFMSRVIAWKMSILIALDHPIFGGGFHAIQNWPVWSSYSNSFHRLDFIPTPQPGDGARAAHSIYFEVLGDLGFSGLFFFLALLFVSFLNMLTIRRLAKKNPEMTWAADLASMLQANLIVYCVSGAALSMAYFELLYIELAILACLRRMLTAEIGTKILPAMALRQPVPAARIGPSLQS